MKMMILVLLVVLFTFTESIPINSASNLRFSGVEGGSCQGGEHRPFLTKNHPVPYTDSAPFELALPDGTTESIPVQPASERSTGTCEERSSCELSPTETNNGASGCESEAASVVCCSETKCEAFDGRQGVCMLDSKCAVKEDDKGKYESISDIVYVGTAKGAKRMSTSERRRSLLRSRIIYLKLLRLPLLPKNVTSVMVMIRQCVWLLY